MTDDRSAFDPLASQELFARNVRDAAEHARDTYGALSSAYRDASDGRTLWVAGRPGEQILRSLDAALRMEAAEGHSTLAATLLDAATTAERLDQLLDRSTGSWGTAGVQLDLFRGQHDAVELLRVLDAAASRAERMMASHRPWRRTRAQDEALRAHRAAVAAFEFRSPGAGTQTIEVTLPGVLLGLAALLLPAAHRSRYSEEFRAELRDLPSDQQVGYAARQCLFALTLRRGLTRPFWRASGSGQDVDSTRSDRR